MVINYDRPSIIMCVLIDYSVFRTSLKASGLQKCLHGTKVNTYNFFLLWFKPTKKKKKGLEKKSDVLTMQISREK